MRRAGRRARRRAARPPLLRSWVAAAFAALGLSIVGGALGGFGVLRPWDGLEESLLLVALASWGALHLWIAWLLHAGGARHRRAAFMAAALHSLLACGLFVYDALRAHPNLEFVGAPWLAAAAIGAVASVFARSAPAPIEDPQRS